MKKVTGLLLAATLVLSLRAVVSAEDGFDSTDDFGKDGRGGMRKMHELIQDEIIMGYDVGEELRQQIEDSRAEGEQERPDQSEERAQEAEDAEHYGEERGD